MFRYGLAATLGVCLLGVTGVAPASARPPTAQTTVNPAEVRSGQYRVDPNHTRVAWSVSHNGFSTFQAMLPDVSGSLVLDAARPEASKLDISIDMTKASSGLPRFDESLKGASIFNTSAFPSATFKSTRIERYGERDARVTGDLTFLGVTRPVTLDVRFNRAGLGSGAPGYRLGFDAKAVIDRDQFGFLSMPSIGNQAALVIEAEFLLSEPKP